MQKDNQGCKTGQDLLKQFAADSKQFLNTGATYDLLRTNQSYSDYANHLKDCKQCKQAIGQKDTFSRVQDMYSKFYKGLEDNITVVIDLMTNFVDAAVEIVSDLLPLFGDLFKDCDRCSGSGKVVEPVPPICPDCIDGEQYIDGIAVACSGCRGRGKLPGTAILDCPDCGGIKRIFNPD